MATYASNEMTITTWGADHWRVRTKTQVAEFDAPRDTDVVRLFRLARIALRKANR